MYSINDAYIEAWQKATNNKLNEAAPLGDDVYNKVLNTFKNKDTLYAFIGQQVLDTLNDYSEYIPKDKAYIDMEGLEKVIQQIYESNASDYIKKYIKDIAVGQLEQLDLIDDAVKDNYNNANKLSKNDRINQYIDRFQNAINKEEMYKVIDEAYYDSNLSGKEFQDMINNQFRAIIEDNFNVEMDNKDGLTVYQQIIQHKF